MLINSCQVVNLCVNKNKKTLNPKSNQEQNLSKSSITRLPSFETSSARISFQGLNLSKHLQNAPEAAHFGAALLKKLRNKEKVDLISEIQSMLKEKGISNVAVLPFSEIPEAARRQAPAGVSMFAPLYDDSFKFIGGSLYLPRNVENFSYDAESARAIGYTCHELQHVLQNAENQLQKLAIKNGVTDSELISIAEKFIKILSYEHSDTLHFPIRQYVYGNRVALGVDGDFLQGNIKQHRTAFTRKINGDMVYQAHLESPWGKEIAASGMSFSPEKNFDFMVEQVMLKTFSDYCEYFAGTPNLSDKNLKFIRDALILRLKKEVEAYDVGAKVFQLYALDKKPSAKANASIGLKTIDDLMALTYGKTLESIERVVTDAFIDVAMAMGGK